MLAAKGLLWTKIYKIKLKKLTIFPFVYIRDIYRLESSSDGKNILSDFIFIGKLI